MSVFFTWMKHIDWIFVEQAIEGRRNNAKILTYGITAFTSDESQERGDEMKKVQTTMAQ